MTFYHNFRLFDYFKSPLIILLKEKTINILKFLTILNAFKNKNNSSGKY